MGIKWKTFKMFKNIFFVFFLSICNGQRFHAMPEALFYPETQMDKPCRTPRFEEGSCVRISDCVPENRYLYIGEDRKTTKYLRSSACGFDVNTPKICCPYDEIRGFKTTKRTKRKGIIP